MDPNAPVHDDTLMILRAASFAGHAHSRQMRKTGHEPYVNHLLRVAEGAAAAGLSAEAVAAALLHDAVEDTAVTLDEITHRFSNRVAELVGLLTQWWPDDAPKEVKQSERPKYYATILKDPEAIELKLLDRADNLMDMARMLPVARSWAEKYCRRSEEELKDVYEASKNEFVRHAYIDALKTLKDRLDRTPTNGPRFKDRSKGRGNKFLS